MIQRQAPVICLVGLAILASLATAAPDLPAPPSVAPGPAGPPPSSADRPSSQEADPAPRPDMIDGEEYDEEFMPSGEGYLEYGDEYEAEYEDEYEEASTEERLSELAEEHYAVKRDCQDMQTMIAQEKQSNQTVDLELLDAYQGCKKALLDIQTEMEALTIDIFDDEKSLT